MKHYRLDHGKMRVHAQGKFIHIDDVIALEAELAKVKETAAVTGSIVSSILLVTNTPSAQRFKKCILGREVDSRRSGKEGES